MSESIHFDDLSNYSHQIAPFQFAGVKNVGWLNVESNYRLGSMQKPILQKLKDLAGGAGNFLPLVEPIRELPTCQLCGAIELFDAKGKKLPKAELWIPGNQVIYAAPIEMLHFIEVHNYFPPDEYISAVIAVDTSISFVADDIYREKLKDCGWLDRKR